MRWWDLPHLRAIEEASFGSDAWSEAMFFSELAQVETRQYWVARDETEIVGYAGLCVYGVETPFNAWIQTIAVAPGRRREGIAQTLLQHLRATAVQRGAVSLMLEVRDDNVAAQKFYAREGFEATARREGYYVRGTVDAVIMQLSLVKDKPRE